MHTYDIKVGSIYLIVGGTGYRVVDGIANDRVAWHDDSIRFRICYKNTFAKACAEEISMEELLKRFGKTRLPLDPL